MRRENWDDYADLMKFAMCAVITWALAVAGCIGVWLLYKGWAAFWTAFGRLWYWGLP